MTSDQFRAWMAQEGLSVRRAAVVLGCSPAAVQNMASGVSRDTGKPVTIDRRTALACAAISAKLKPWGEGA
jgi:predicted transcriptional regulator